MVDSNWTDTPHQGIFRVTTSNHPESFLLGIAINRCLVMIFGIPGNVIVLYTTFYCKKLQTITNMLTIQIAISNLLQCTLNIPYNTYIIFHRDRQHSLITCNILAHLLVVEILTTILVFAIVAINRYILVVNGKTASKQVFSRFKTGVVIALTWCWAFILSLLPDAGLGKLGYNHLLVDCLFVIEDWNTYLYLIVLCATTLAPCIIITGVCYAKIAMLLWNVNNKIHNATTVIVKSVAETNRKIRTIQTVLSLMVIFMGYLSVWAPFGVIILGDSWQPKWPPALYSIVAHLILAQNAIFPVIYGTFNRNHREAHWLAVTGQWKLLRKL